MVRQDGGFPYQRENSWTRNDSRAPLLEIGQQERFPPPPQQQQQQPHPVDPPTIQDVLKDAVGPVQDFALIVRLKDGQERIYSSPHLRPHCSEIISESVKNTFRHYINRVDRKLLSNGYSQDPYNEYDVPSGEEHRKVNTSSRRHRTNARYEESDEDGSTSARKRARYPDPYRQRSIDDATVPVPIQRTQQLRVGDDEEVEKLYAIRFKDMQQWSCKIMGKAFVKLVEPKKQTHHPYTKKEEGAPDWWPRGTGDNKVRHKEPDHLLKPERIKLLVHILLLIVEPRHKQCEAVQKLGLTVKKLEETTMECLSNWFNDKENPDNANKRPYLKEIFKVAKAQERYKNGEIDGSTMIPVMYGDPTRTSSEDEIDEYSGSQDDEESQVPTPESLVSPQLPIIMNQHLQAQLDSENRMRPSLGRHNSNQQLHDAQYSGGDNQFYPGKYDVGYNQPQSPGLALRRFNSPGFNGPQNNMPGLQWQPHNQILSSQNGNSNGNGGGFYVTSPSQSLPPLTGPYLPPPIQHQQTQQAMHPPLIIHHQQFEPLQGPGGRSFDTANQQHHGMRTGSLGHPHQQHNGFQFEGFLHGDGVGIGVNGGFGQQEGDMLKSEAEGQGGMGNQHQG